MRDFMIFNLYEKINRMERYFQNELKKVDWTDIGMGVGVTIVFGVINPYIGATAGLASYGWLKLCGYLEERHGFDFSHISKP